MQKTKKNKSKKKNRLFHIIIFILGLNVVWIFANQQIQLRRLSKEEEAARQRIEQLKADVAALEEEIKRADDPASIEKVAREQLKMVKPNEIIYIHSGKKVGGEKEKGE